VKKLLWLVPISLLLTAPALAKDPSAADYGPKCAKLEKTLIKGRDADATKKVKAWLFDALAKGPDGKPMAKKDVNTGCGMVLGDKASLDGYKKKADEAAAK
jgi:hypothetical protein